MKQETEQKIENAFANFCANVIVLGIGIGILAFGFYLLNLRLTIIWCH